MKTNLSSKSGFTLLELLVVLGILALVFAVVTALGFGVAFTFASTVLVPWLGVPAAYAHAVTLLLSLMLTGAGTIAVVLALALIGVLFSIIARAFKGKSRRS